MAHFRIPVGDTSVAVYVSSASELVKIMHANSLAQSADDQAWMEDVAERTLDPLKKIALRTHSPEAFVNDMARHGLIQYVPDYVFPEEK